MTFDPRPIFRADAAEIARIQLMVGDTFAAMCATAIGERSCAEWRQKQEAKS